MNTDRNVARFAGFLYLVVYVTGILGTLYLPSKIIIPGDLAATANNLIANELLYRLAVVNNFLGQIFSLFVVLVLYLLLKKVNANQAAFMVTLVLAGVPIMILNLVNQIAPLVILTNPNVTAAFSADQLNATVTLFLNLYKQGIALVEVFWGLWLIPLGWLVYKSGFMPRPIGVLLIIGGTSYIINCFTTLLFPSVGAVIAPIMLVPAAIAELSMVLWLLIWGVKQPKVIAKSAPLSLSSTSQRI